MSYLVGLTGGIGSGKTTVAGLFSAMGVRIIDTDHLSHRLTSPGGAAIPAIRKAFGEAYIAADGSLDRARMRARVFSDKAERQRLEAILHPLILAEAKQQAASPTCAPYTLLVVPLLFESGHYTDWLNRTVVVDCPETLQMVRTMQRSQLGEGEVRAILAAQLDRESRLRLADEVIHNEGTLDSLKEQVIKLHRRLSELAAQTN